MDLDEETRAMLGWGSERDDRDDRLSPTRLGGQMSRIAPGDVDGRSKRNWRHRKMPANGPARPVVRQSTQEATID